jgi:beta-lactamase regulating signal transducer with metallopeptidase domain
MSSLVAAMVNGALVSAVVTALVWLALRIAPRRALNAATRYVVWWLVLAISVTLPLAWLPIHTSAPRPAQGRAVRLAAPPEPVRIVHTAPLPTLWAERGDRSIAVAIPAGPWPSWIAAAWLITTVLVLLRLIASFVFLERRKARAVDASAHLAAHVETWLARCGGTKRRVRLAVSPEISTPIAAGPRNPTILIPARFLEALEDDELDQIGLHEAAHLARRDDYALLLQRLLTAVFVWHPVARWIGRRIDLEREIACDDIVVEAMGRARPYAACLTRVMELATGASASPLAAAAADERSHFSARVEMLLDGTRRTGARLLKGRLATVAAALVTLACVAARAPALVAFATPRGDTTKQAPATSPPRVPTPAQAPTPAQTPDRTLAFAPPQPPQAPAASHATALVEITVTVTDPLGRFVTGLQKEHFKLFENGVEQEISELLNDDAPLSIGTVFDVSQPGSPLEESRQALNEFTSAVNPAIEFFRVEQSKSLRDGILYVADALRSARHPRRAILIVTDNPGSYQSSPPVELHGSQIYVVVAGSADAGGPLVQLCDQTGGAYFAPVNPAEMSSIMAKIGIELRNQYALRYIPKEAPRAGEYREVHVELVAPRGLPPLKATSRQGYSFPAQ